MRTRIQSLSALRKIAFKRRRHIAAALLAVMLTLLAVGTRAAEQHQKPTFASAADLRFEPLDPDEAAAAAATVVSDFTSVDPATIHNMTEVRIPATGTSGFAAPYPLNIVVSDFQGTVGRVAVRLHNLSHTYPTDLLFLLVGPGGQKVMLMAVVGGHNPVEGLYLTFEDGAPQVPANSLVSGTYSPTNPTTSFPLPPAPPKPYGTSLSSFAGTNPNGTWSLYVYDGAGDDVGSLSGFSLVLSPELSNNTVVPIPDCPSASCPPDPVVAVESPIQVSGITGWITKVTVSFHITHTWDSNLDIGLVGPDNTTVTLVEDRGGPAATNFGNSCGSRTVIDDAATAGLGAGTAPFVGTFRPESPLAAFYGKTGAGANGTWKLRIKDDAAPNVGALQCWSIVISAEDGPSLQSPTALRVSSMAGNEVTLRWAESRWGNEVTGYVLEGGMNPGETVASFATNTRAPIFTFVAPTGSFFVRVRGQRGAELSPPSNEIPLHVNVPVQPSPPGLLQGVANGDAVALAWRNTFEGGPPSSLILDVSGDFNGSFPLPLTDNISFSGVPPGTYYLKLRATNDGGTSDPGLTSRNGFSPSTEPLKLTFPAACSGPPQTPSRFLAYTSGSTLYAVWEPPTTGRAATEYVLHVDGSYVGSFTTTVRALKGDVAPGTYNLSVAAQNSCGVSPATPAQLIVVP